MRGPFFCESRTKWRLRKPLSTKRSTSKKKDSILKRTRWVSPASCVLRASYELCPIRMIGFSFEMTSKSNSFRLLHSCTLTCQLQKLNRACENAWSSHGCVLYIIRRYKDLSLRMAGYSLTNNKYVEWVVSSTTQWEHVCLGYRV